MIKDIACIAFLDSFSKTLRAQSLMLCSIMEMRKDNALVHRAVSMYYFGHSMMEIPQ